MSIGNNIKKIRKEKGVLQKEAAATVGMNQSNYNRMENGHREPTVTTLKKLSELFGVSVDHLIDPEKDRPKEVQVSDKATKEQLRLIAQLDEEDRKMVFRMIDKLLTNRKFKKFFEEHVKE
jgi:transcriptional regulator with XRE-family HTH domain